MPRAKTKEPMNNNSGTAVTANVSSMFYHDNYAPNMAPITTPQQVAPAPSHTVYYVPDYS